MARGPSPGAPSSRLTSPEPRVSSDGTILARRRENVSWFKISDGRLRYRGRITRQPLTEWAATPEGAAAVDAVARSIRFSVLGRTRSAKWRLRRELERTVANEQVRTVLDRAPDWYLDALTQLAYAPALPRIVISLRRLVVIPRTMVAARSRSALNSRLMTCPAYADMNESLRAFLCDRLVWEMDDAIRRAKPSARRSIAALESWACVALDNQFVWIDPLWSGKDWLGHMMMFEMPERGSKRDRQQLEAAIQELQGSLSGLSQVQRDGAVRSAIAGLNPARA